MTAVEILKQARTTFAAANWERNGVYAVDQRGWSADPEGPDAVGYCAIGALRSVAGWHECDEDLWGLLYRVSVEKTGHGITWFNDLHAKDKAEVLALFDEAIRRVELMPA